MDNYAKIAAYYFPNYHFDPRNEAFHGPGWNEWELMRKATPRFPGHHQPKIPLWGYEDESDPQVMAKKIDAAVSHGVDAFLFDWYYYNDGPFLEKTLLDGFQKAPNASELHYALMWANHDWTNIHPIPEDRNAEILYHGSVTMETFDRMTDYIIEKHFRHPSYWKISEKPYFSIYEVYRLAAGLGGWEKAAEALAMFRKKTKAAGFPGLFLNAVLWGVQLLPNETGITHPEEIVNELRFDSVTSYVWVHHAQLEKFPRTPAGEVFETNRLYWESARKQFEVPYFPNVTMGWDASPRTLQHIPYTNAGYPAMPVMEQSPQEFGAALDAALRFVSDLPEEQRIVTINAWNEWTEGSYLEPDEEHGFAFLEEIARAKKIRTRCFLKKENAVFSKIN